MEAQPPSPTPDGQDAEAERAARLFAESLSTGGAGPARVRVPSIEEIASLFPKLEILEVLGQGGMGVVYKARQARLDRVVALKVLYRELAEDPAFPERFEREAKALARLDHPHIVRVHDFGETGGLYWLLLEYVDGASLRELMADGQMGPGEALGIVPQVCDALQYAHDQGVVHRDIKPENLLIDAAAQVKIADFGLAKLVGQDGPAATLTGTHQVMGTWQYMAPEQYRAPQDVDHRADIFSLGVVFYEMLTGDLPVGRYQQPSQTQTLDRRIDAIVMRTLEREREARYQQAKDVRHDVEAVEQSAPPVEPSAQAVAMPPDATVPPSPAAPDSGLHVEFGLEASAPSIPPRWLLVLATATLPLGIVVMRLFRARAADGLYADVAGVWSTAQIVTTAVWVVGMLCAVLALRRSRTAAIRGGAAVVLLILLAFLGTVWLGSRSSYWGSFLTSRTVDYRTSIEPWAIEAQSRYASGAPMPVVRVLGGQERDAAWMRDTVTEILRTWQRLAYRSNDVPFGALTSRGFYPDAEAEAIYTMDPALFEREREALQLGLPFVTEVQLGRPLREFYVHDIEVDPYEKKARVEAVPREHGAAVVVTFPMVSGGTAGDWRYARGPVTILNQMARAPETLSPTKPADLLPLLPEGGTLPTVEGGQLDASREDVLRGVLTLWRKHLGMARDRDLTYDDLQHNDRVDKVYGPADARALFDWIEPEFDKARERLELGMGFVTLDQMGIAPHRCQVVHIELDENERTARVEVRPIARRVNRGPRMAIVTLWPGASPEAIEQEIVLKQERALRGAEGATRVLSESAEGRGELVVEFVPGTDMDEADRMLRARLAQVDGYPEGAASPVLERLGVKPGVDDPRPKPAFFFQVRRDEGRWWFAVKPVEIDR